MGGFCSSPRTINFSMSELPEDYPMLHIDPSKEARQPVIIKGNAEGLCALVNALISAIAHPNSSGVAEVRYTN